MLKRSLVLMLVVMLSGTVYADAVLTSNFDLHNSTDGATSFTGISWATNGVTDPGSTIALTSGNATVAKVQRGGATVSNNSRLAVEYNIDTQVSWTMDITFDAATAGLTLEDMSFDYQFITGSGGNQGTAHLNSGVIDVSILDGSLSQLSTVNVGPLGTSDAASNSGTGILADFADVALTNGQTYTLRFTVSSNATAGNNIAIDNLSLNGVPEPATMSLLALGGIAMLRRRKK